MALVFTRKVREGFWIGDAFVRINDVRRGKVKVSIQAPRDVRVLRDELEPYDPPASEPGDEPQRTQ